MTDPWNPLGAWRDVVARQQQTAADVLAILARRLQGRRFDLAIAGRSLRLVVGRVEVRDGAAPHQLRVELGEVQWDGWPLKAVYVAADNVRLSTFPSAHIVASGVRVDGQTALRTAAAWLDGYVHGWSLGVGGDGRIEVRHNARPHIRLSVEVVARDHHYRVEVCTVRWRRVRLSLPLVLRLRRTVPLPALPLGATVVCACRDGDAVAVRLAIPQISRSLSTNPLAAG